MPFENRICILDLRSIPISGRFLNQNQAHELGRLCGWFFYQLCDFCIVANLEREVVVTISLSDFGHHCVQVLLGFSGVLR